MATGRNEEDKQHSVPGFRRGERVRGTLVNLESVKRTPFISSGEKRACDLLRTRSLTGGKTGKLSERKRKESLAALRVWKGRHTSRLNARIEEERTKIPRRPPLRQGAASSLFQLVEERKDSTYGLATSGDF